MKQRGHLAQSKIKNKVKQNTISKKDIEYLMWTKG